MIHKVNKCDTWASMSFMCFQSTLAFMNRKVSKQFQNFTIFFLFCENCESNLSHPDLILYHIIFFILTCCLTHSSFLSKLIGSLLYTTTLTHWSPAPPPFIHSNKKITDLSLFEHLISLSQLFFESTCFSNTVDCVSLCQLWLQAQSCWWIQLIFSTEPQT